MTKNELIKLLKPYLQTQESISTIKDLDEMEIESFMTDVCWTIGDWEQHPDEVADLFSDYFACEIA